MSPLPTLSPPPLTGAFTTPGKRPYQHDRYIIHHSPTITLLAVADGHGHDTHGHVVAHYIQAELVSFLNHHKLFQDITSPDAATRLRAAVSELDEGCLTLTRGMRVYAGSTLCMVLFDREAGVCLVGNVGDSRAVMVGEDGVVMAMSRDHVPGDEMERKRIEGAGGWVVGGMLNGYVSMSRGLGDEDLKAHRNLTAFEWGMREKRRFGEQLFVGDVEVGKWVVGTGDWAVVVGSDGVWGKLSNQGVGDLVKCGLGGGLEADIVARRVAKRAMGKGSRDNVTVVVGVVGGGGDGSDSSPRDVMEFGRRKGLSAGWNRMKRRVESRLAR